MFDVVYRHFNAGISRSGEANSRGEKGAAHSLTDSFDQAANLAGSPAPISVANDPVNDPVSFRKTHEASISRALDDGVIDDTFRAHLDAYARMSGQSASSTAKPTPLAIKTAHQMMQRALNDSLPDPRIGPSADAATFVNALQAGKDFQQTIVVGGKPAIVTGEFSNTNGRKAYTVSAQMDPHPTKVAILEFMPSKNGNKQLTHALLEPNAPGKLVLHMEKVGQFFADAAQHMSVMCEEKTKAR
jgi:hypothetical protein